MSKLPVNIEPEVLAFREDTLQGLRGEQKSLPIKYHYDEQGSRLFDAICELPEYYLTQTEIGILCENADEMAEYLGRNIRLVEYGSGSSVKTRILLDHLVEPAAYVPLDISRKHLLESAACLRHEFPHIPVMPICADYTQEFQLPEVDCDATSAFFPGSTIGNFTPSEAINFLKGVARVVGTRGSLLIGVDVWKNAAILNPAYDDAGGVVAQFNLNLLSRINRELHGQFDLSTFRHKAEWNPIESRMELLLQSLVDQRIRVAGENFTFLKNETIVTGYSHKWRPDVFVRLAREAGWEVERVWRDESNLFSVQYLRVC